jgi:hypothetical protein
VAKQELNLLQFAASGAAKSSAASTEIVRCEFAYANLGSKFLDDMPNELLCHLFAPHSVGTTYPSEEAAAGNSGGRRPVV